MSYQTKIIYAVYFVKTTSDQYDPQDFDKFTESMFTSWTDVARKELLSGDDLTRVDVYDAGEYEHLLGSEIDLSWLGECLGSYTREDLEAEEKEQM